MDIKDAISPVSQSSVELNNAKLMDIRHMVALGAGAVAGTLHLESLHGFGFYFLVYVVTALIIAITIRTPQSYFLKPWKAVLWDGVLPALPGYVLAWSLVYTLVET